MSLAQRSAAILQHGEPLKKRRKSTLRIKPSMIAVYASVFLLVVAIISIGYQKPESSTTVANATNIAVSNQTDEVSVDDVVASSVAAAVAQTANLPIATSVSNLAVSTQTMAAISQTESTSATKPQIIESVVSNRLVKTYTAVIGDTVTSLSTKFGISAQTIKWANNMVGDAISVGASIKILPIDGVLYTVKTDDTVDSIAKKYQVDATRLVTYNDLEVSGLQPNSEIILPDGILPDNEKPGYVAPVTTQYYSSSMYIAMSPNNGYAYGNCTWYAYERRMSLGLQISGNWGNANTWAIYAAGSGYLVDHNPTVGAVLVDTSGYYGHVAVVESVEANGDIIISEMNNYAYGGWNKVNNRTISSGQASVYRYIH